MYLPPLLHKLRKSCRRAIAERVNERIVRHATRDAPAIVTDDAGFRFTLHPWMRPYARNLLHRSTTSGQYAAIDAVLDRDGIIFDVGAHAGRFSAFVDGRLSERGRVYAFEPVPETYWMLRENLMLNRCTKVIATQAAVCDRVGRVEMNLFAPEFSSWNSMGKPQMTTPAGQRVSPQHSLSVAADTLDAFCEREGIERIDLLKVDVEGCEASVFRGARRLLSQRRIGRICFEISTDPLAGAGVTARDVFAELQFHGYAVYDYDAAARRFRGPLHDSSAYWANYYASAEPLEGLCGLTQVLMAA